VVGGEVVLESELPSCCSVELAIFFGVIFFFWVIFVFLAGGASEEEEELEDSLELR